MTAPTPTAALKPEELAEKLRQITEMHAKATGGIWYSHGGYLSTRPSITNSIYDLDEMGQQTLSSPFQAVPFYSQGDANFCASAHQDVPWLVELAQSQARKIEAQRAEIERLTKERDRARDQTGRSMDLTDQAQDAAEAWKDRATAAEAALSAMNPANPDWREVAMSNGKALGERNAAWDRLNDELAASQERERGMREAAQPVADAFRKHRTAMDAINALNEGGGDPGADIDALWREADAASEEIDRAMEQFCAALKQQETADVR